MTSSSSFVLGVVAVDNLREGISRNLGCLALDLFQDEVGELEAVDCLELDVHGVKPMPEVRLGNVLRDLPDAELFLVMLRAARAWPLLEP